MKITKELNYIKIDIGRYEFRIYPYRFLFLPKVEVNIWP